MLPAFHPIGFIRTAFRQQAGTPIQPARAQGAEGTIEILPAYAEGLQDLDRYSHAHLIFVFHKSEGFNLQVTPYLDDTPRGLFATRAPRRPNPIGLSVVRILAVEGTTIRVADVDMLDGTPLLDIKPFVPAFDHRPEAATGWFGKGGRPDGDCADDRFEGWEGGSKAPSQ